MRRTSRYADPTVCDNAWWRRVRVKSGKFFSIRCSRPPYDAFNRYVTVLGPKEVKTLLELFKGKAIKYYELGETKKGLLARLMRKKLVVIAHNDDVVLTDGGRSVARLLDEHFNQKNRPAKGRGEGRERKK